MKRYFWAIALLLLLGCQENKRAIPVNPSDKAPQPLTYVQVKNLPGGAMISYSLPKSGSLLYVLAQYSLKDSQMVEKKSSYYNNSITIQGFPDTKTHNVKLYAVSRGGKKSDPVDVVVTPLEPPVTGVFRSLIMQPTFGGVNVSFLNKSDAKVKITVLTPDSMGLLSTADIHYTQIDSGDFSVRGYDSVRRKFGVFVRDRWNNYSDTLFVSIKPYYEEELDKSKFKGVPLPNDTYKPYLDDGFSDLWDGIWDVGNPVFHTGPGNGWPQSFTFDLGKTVQLSRFKFYSRNTGGTDGAYYAGDPKIWELWGSNNPNPDGTWDSWTLLGRFTSIKPSGQAKPTSEDIQYACVDGQNFNFPIKTPPVRYLRFKTIETWGGVHYIYISELTFYGSYK